MVDITAKRGPIDPNKYINDQGIATKSVLQDINSKQAFKREQSAKKGDWLDQIGRYAKLAADVYSGVSSYMDAANTAEADGLDIQAQKAARTKQEANNTKQASALSSEAITSKLEKDKETTSLEFKKKIESAIDANNEDDVVRYSLEDIKAAKENKDLLEQIAQ